MTDYIVRATAADSQIRAFAITSRKLVEQARVHHNSSPVVTAALGRLLSGGAMMGVMMKGDSDILTIQVKGGGPMKGMTVTADSKGNVKGYPKVPDVLLPANSKGKLDVAGAVGIGIMSVIKDMGLKEPYVGQIALQTSEIAEDLTYYFATSEQVPSAVGLGVLMEKNNTVKQAGGFIIQLMPFTQEKIIARLEEKIAEVKSVTDLLEQGMTPEDILEHILGEFGVEFTDTIPAQFSCNCSKERVSKAMISIGKRDIQEMIDDGKNIEVNCHFCNTGYEFTPAELAELLKEAKTVKHGYIKTAAVTPKVRVADPVYNGTVICEKIDEALEAGAQVIVFPELCITGYSCGDLFWQETLLSQAKYQLFRIADHTQRKSGIIFVGLPLTHEGKLYNVAAALSNGRILGLVPKTAIPNYNEFYEARYFTKGNEEPVPVELVENEAVPMGTKLLFSSPAMPELVIGAEICEDLWMALPPSTHHALAGANLMVNLSASDETTGKDIYRKALVEGQSARLLCGYVYASAGDGESTQDVVYSGHNLICENGTTLAESERFVSETIYGEIDVQKMNAERRRINTFVTNSKGYLTISFLLRQQETPIGRLIAQTPFVPDDLAQRTKRCEEILSIQAMGLKRRLEHTNCKCAVVGISGGLDSTLALLVTVRAFDLLRIPREGIFGVTMPGFGTTDRTYDNAVKMIRCVGAAFLEVDIKNAVQVHFQDIGQEESVHDVTYENSQARERTQILMDIANKNNGMVIGTGDLSELALGWATYNGDHMSMYGVNGSVPKTLVRHLVRYYADTCEEEELRGVLLDVLDTPVSPELLPPEEGQIAQKTEDIVGPYELHDFYLYYMMRFGFAPAKIFRLAKQAFAGVYEDEIILKWMKTFYRRFFSQQFKRSCLPDGPKVGSVALSPRGDLRMPSDACVRIWMDELEML